MSAVGSWVLHHWAWWVAISALWLAFRNWLALEDFKREGLSPYRQRLNAIEHALEAISNRLDRDVPPRW